LLNLANDIKRVILIAVALMVIGVIVPIAVGLIANAGNVIVDAGNSTSAPLDQVADPSVILMIEVLIPIIAVIAIVLMFLPSKISK